MRIEDMNDIQLIEVTMRWNIEYNQSYLDAIHRGDINYPPNTTELEMLRAHEEADRRVQESISAYDHFIAANAEWFI